MGHTTSLRNTSLPNVLQHLHFLSGIEPIGPTSDGIWQSVDPHFELIILRMEERS